MPLPNDDGLAEAVVDGLAGYIELAMVCQDTDCTTSESLWGFVGRSAFCRRCGRIYHNMIVENEDGAFTIHY